MEVLPKDIRTYLVRRFLVLASLRNLLCVSKSYYLLFKFYVRIQTVPVGDQGAYTPMPCVICQNYVDGPPWNWQGPAWIPTPRNSKLSKRSIGKLIPKKGLVECEQGHRYLCHAGDNCNDDITCPKCQTQLKKKIKL